MPISTTPAGGLRNLASRLLKQSAGREKAEVQAKVEDKIKNVRSSLNLDLDLSLLCLVRPFRSTACLPAHQMVNRKKRYELKGQHAITTH